MTRLSTLPLTLRKALLCLLILSPASVLAEMYTLNLKDVEIEALVEMVSEATKKNFVLDERVKGKVTVISASPMSEEELYQTFLSVLSVHGFAAIPSGRIVKVVPEAVAKSQSAAEEKAAKKASGDEIVTRVIAVKHVSAAQLVPILRPLVPQQGHLAAQADNNVLVISDRAANIQRLESIIRRVDQASQSQVEVIMLQHASATEVMRILGSLEQPAAGQAAVNSPLLVPDERTNSLLISASPAERLRLKTLIAHLDTPLQTVGNTQVVFLRYARAADLVEVLAGVSDNLQKGPNNNTAPPATAKGADGKPGVKLNTNIQADEATNSLVITAAPDVLQSLLSVIRQLDIRREQVLVEAIIAEVSAEKAQEFGVQWLLEGTNRNTVPIGAINFGSPGNGVLDWAGAAASNSLPSSFPNGGLLGIGRFADTGVNFGMLVKALAGNSGVNILSTPSILTLDNQEAKIVVGKNVPFLTGQYTTSVASGVNNPFQTIQREDVGLTLVVKPQINEGDSVKLEISQEISSLASDSLTTDVVTNKRTIETVVMVDNGNMVVLGGLIDETLQDATQKVPGLGDIPVLGGLFRYQESKKEKRSLMVFLRPLILRDSATQSRLSQARYEKMRDYQLAHRADGVPFTEAQEIPVLPSLNDFITVMPGGEETLVLPK